MFGLQRLFGSRTKIVPVLSPEAIEVRNLLRRHGQLDIAQIVASSFLYESRVKTLLMELTRAKVVKSKQVQVGGEHWTVWMLR